MRLRRRRRTQDFQSEIASHLAHEAEELQREGVAPRAARSAAERGFGNTLRAQERSYEGTGGLVGRAHEAGRDVRFGLNDVPRRECYRTIKTLK